MLYILGFRRSAKCNVKVFAALLLARKGVSTADPVSSPPHHYQLPFTVNLLIFLFALMPAVAFLMPLSINDANTQPIAAVTKRQLDGVSQATNEDLHARMPPVDLSDLPTDFLTLEKMVIKYEGIIKKANDRVKTLRNGQPAPLPETEYLQMVKKSREEITRIGMCIEQLTSARI
ncbi:hypothetical protein V8E36_005109 [Tilletia maclaganii]